MLPGKEGRLVGISLDASEGGDVVSIDGRGLAPLFLPLPDERQADVTLL